jgi:hypothetical protein
LLLLLTLPTVVQAQYFIRIIDGTVTIFDYFGAGGDVIIPRSFLVNGVSLPVTTIEIGAFSGCTNLTSVTIPRSVTRIGNSAFSDCTNLTAITVDALNAYYSSVDGVLFDRYKTILIECPGGKAGSYTVPNSVTSIGSFAFDTCTSLTGVTIPNSATSIGDGAFYQCSSLTSVTIGDSVTSIGDDAFYNCTSLNNVTIPDSVTNIGRYAFFDCTSLTAITVDVLNSFYSSVDGVLFNKSQTTLIQCPKGKAGSDYTVPNSVTDIGSYAFSYCTNLTSVTIPDSVTSIESGAFDSCTSLTNVTIPNSVTSIWDGVFSYCTSLTSVTIPNSVTDIGSYAFSYCTSLTNITIPDSVTYIGWNAFEYCTSLTSVTIGNGVTSIQSQMFQSCTSLTSVTIPNSVTSIGDGVFSYCTSLTSVTIPNNVTSIGWYAFGSCTSLSAITVDTNNTAYSSVDGVLFNKTQTTLIQCPGGKVGSYTAPNSVTIIGGDAFERCINLTNVTIPNSVTSIGGFAFTGCTSLTAITVDALNPAYSSLDGVLFDKNLITLIQCPGGEAGSYSVPNSVTSIGSAFYDCAGLTSVTIPNSVTSIGDYAFYSCINLTGVYFKSNAPSIGSYAFTGDPNATVYYLPGTTGWANFAQLSGLPTVLWNPQAQTSNASFGVQTNRFGFNIIGSSNLVIVVEGCTNLANPAWTPIGTNMLNTFIGTNGTSYFSDPDWTNYPGRFYRLRSP